VRAELPENSPVSSWVEVGWGSASLLLFGFDETSVSLLLMIGLLLFVEVIRAFALPEPLLSGQNSLYLILAE
jgi:hypothetical protein